MFTFEKYPDLETSVRGHSNSLEMTPLDKQHMTLYSRSIVTMALACTVSELHV